MKKFILAILIIFAVLTVRTQNLRAYLSFCTFYSPTDGPYIETYISFDGKYVSWIKNDNGKYIANLDVLILFKKDSLIENFKKYNFSSPIVDDTSDVNFNFIDQQRFLLANGKYEFEINIKDKNSNQSDELQYSTLIDINYSDSIVSISGIQLADSYSKSNENSILSKSGYDIIPYIAAYYPKDINKIKFYSEIYNTSEIYGNDYKYLINMYIKSFASGLKVDNFSMFRRSNSSKVNVLLSEMDISNLPSGNYYLVVEARDQNNDIMAVNEVFFQRNNPAVTFELPDIEQINITNTFVDKYNNIDSLREYIMCLSPISSETEKQFSLNGLKNNDIIWMKQYFLNFWQTRNPFEPQVEWMNYNNMVIAVDNAFGTRIRKGWETDRGRVYLQYGPPNSRQEVAYEPNAYPYEIWHYYALNQRQRNKRFVFYLPDLVTGDYELLHSDAVGEVSFPMWERKLNRDNTLLNFDENDYNSHWGSRARQLYNNPR